MPTRRTIFWALFALSLMPSLPKMQAQESLGDKARRIRAGKEQEESAAKSGAARKTMTPTAADLSATVNLIAETDPEKYSAGVRDLLDQDRFQVLDDISAGERVNKARFAGGEWKLYTFYEALATPGAGSRGVVADWNAYRERFNRWVAQQPGSITARVAQADAELMYAWQLRATSDVNPESHRLFDERLKLAASILNQASDLPLKCPQWFNVMMQVGRAAGWQVQDQSALFQRAIEFEPQYYYFYQQHALTLTTKWLGKDGDMEKFATETANRVGGKPGNILYWQIAQSIIGNRDLGNIPQHFSWSQALIGYQALVEQYGASLLRQNQNTLMAAKFGDYMTADDLFLQIGDHFDAGTWGTQEYFEKVRNWARSSAGPFKKIVEAYQAVNVNIGTPEGLKYDGQISREFSAHFASLVRNCASTDGGQAPTLLILQVSKTGTVQQMLVVPQTASDACLRPRVEKAWFSPPPKPEYWVRVNLNAKP